MKWITAVLVTAVVATPAYAEAANAGGPPETRSIRTSVERVRFEGNTRGWSYLPQARAGGRATVAQKASAAFAIGFLGMLAGAWLGARLERECYCDDPGLKGAMIGMPI